MPKQKRQKTFFMTNYDVVVVGSGNAGMAAALHMAQAGKRTLLIEQHNLPGGCATSFRRGRFEIEPSLHELCDVGTPDNPGTVGRLMENYGVKVNWIPVPDCFRSVGTYTDGGYMDVTMPVGVDAFIDAMEKYVPGSRKSMQKLFDLFQEIDAGTAFLMEANGNAPDKVLMKKYPNMLRTGGYHTSQVFEALKLPQRCRDIMATYWSYLGVDLDHLNFIHYAMMTYTYIRLGASIPSHTSHEISTAMTERFRELGGDIWFNCRAEEFLFENEKLYGVKTTAGVVACDYVLANINPDIIYGKMVPKELVPEREKKLSAARQGQYGARMFVAYLCLDATPEELGIRDYSIFMYSHSNSVKAEQNLTGKLDDNNTSIFLCYNIANPQISPEGTCICSFTTYCGAEDWNSLSQRNYVPTKNAVVQRMLDNLKQQLGIDLSGHIEEISVATPWTFARYLGTPEGSVYGHLAYDWDSLMARMMMLGSDYPIPGLRPIGASGPQSDGYSSTYITGQLIASLALADMEQEGGAK